MMAYEIRLFENEPIILVTPATIPDADELRQLHQEIAEQVKNLEPPVYRIIDMTQLSFTVKEMVTVLVEATREREGSLRDRRMNSIYVTGKNRINKLLAEGFAQLRYQGVEVEIFTTLDEALDYIRRQ